MNPLLVIQKTGGANLTSTSYGAGGPSETSTNSWQNYAGTSSAMIPLQSTQTWTSSREYVYHPQTTLGSSVTQASSQPVVQNTGSYGAVFDTVEQLAKSTFEGWKIDEKVIATTNQVISILGNKNIPEPRIFASSPQALVFVWENEAGNYFLRIGNKSLGFTIASPEGIRARARFPGPNIEGGDDLFSAMQNMRMLAASKNE
jgi:hypothetical protein